MLLIDLFSRIRFPCFFTCSVGTTFVFATQTGPIISFDENILGNEVKRKNGMFYRKKLTRY